MDRTLKIDEELDALARHLHENRRTLLETWSAAVAADPELTTASSLPRTQFLDHIPDFLDAFERHVRALPAPESPRLQEDRKDDAGAHASGDICTYASRRSSSAMRRPDPSSIRRRCRSRDAH